MEEFRTLLVVVLLKYIKREYEFKPDRLVFHLPHFDLDYYIKKELLLDMRGLLEIEGNTLILKKEDNFINTLQLLCETVSKL